MTETCPVLLVGSGNPHKLEEIAARLKASGAILRVVGTEILPRFVEIDETGDTFHANAELKARGYAAATLELPASERPTFVVADDSGLCVDALDGAPGVYSARYAGDDADDAANHAKLLGALAEVPDADRTATFHCVMACLRLPPSGSIADAPVRFTEGRCPGTILRTQRGARGFGYDPLFFYPPLERSYAELTGAEKNEISHRGRALDSLPTLLTEL